MDAKEKFLQSLLEAIGEFIREEHRSRIRKGIAFAKQQKRK